jgi:hypothetical protein
MASARKSSASTMDGGGPTGCISWVARRRVEGTVLAGMAAGGGMGTGTGWGLAWTMAGPPREEAGARCGVATGVGGGPMGTTAACAAERGIPAGG